MTNSNSRTDPGSVFLTGAGGLIGKSVLRSLIAHGYRVRALVRSGTLPVTSPLLTVIQGDITSPSDVRRGMVGSLYVIHLAARKADEPDSEAVNVQGTAHVLEAAKEQGVTRLIHVSTPSAALKTAGTYGKTKNRAEELVKASGVPFVIVRPSVVYADLESGILGSIRKFLNLPVVPVIGKGDVTFAPIHAEDLAELFVALLAEERAVGGVYDAGGPEILTFDDMVRQSMEQLGIRKPVVHLPVWVASLLALVFSVLPKPPVTRSNIRGATENVPLHLQELRSIVPYGARTFREGLRSFVMESGMPALSRIEGSTVEGLPAAQKEAVILLRYVLRSFGHVPPPDAAEIGRYVHACEVHTIEAGHRIPQGMTLRMMDASTKLFAPRCTLQKKLLVAAAIAETTPRSAPFLLPKKHSSVSMVLTLAVSAVSSAFTLAGGLCLRLLSPSSWNAYAG